MRDTKFFHAVSLFALLAVGAPGCSDDANGDGDDTAASAADTGSNASRIQSTCDGYCAKENVCNDNGTVEQCVADCKAQLGDCMADEQSQVLNELDDCAAESCNDFGACTFGAGLQCTFGI